MISRLLNKYKQQRLLLLLVLFLAGLLLILSLEDLKEIKQASKNELASTYLLSEQGDDILIYTPYLNSGNGGVYDAGEGLDTIWMRVSEDEYNQPKFRADIIRFYFYLLNHANRGSKSGGGELFHFHSISLQLRNFEFIIIENIDQYLSKRLQPKDYRRLIWPFIRNTQYDSLG